MSVELDVHRSIVMQGYCGMSYGLQGAAAKIAKCVASTGLIEMDADIFSFRWLSNTKIK